MIGAVVFIPENSFAKGCLKLCPRVSIALAKQELVACQLQIILKLENMIRNIANKMFDRINFSNDFARQSSSARKVDGYDLLTASIEIKRFAELFEPG